MATSQSQQLLDYNNADLYPNVLIDGIYKNSDKTVSGTSAISKALAVAMGSISNPSTNESVVLVSGTGSERDFKYYNLDILKLKGLYDPSITNDGTYVYRCEKTGTYKEAGFVDTNSISVGSCNQAFNLVKETAGVIDKINAGSSTTPVYFNNGVPVAATAYADATVKSAGYATNATNITNAAGTGSNIGLSTTPVYVEGGVIKACTPYAQATVNQAVTAGALNGGGAWKIPYYTLSGPTPATGWIDAPTSEQDGMCLTVQFENGSMKKYAWTKPAASVKSDPSADKVYLIGQVGTTRTDELGQVYFNTQNYMQNGTFYQTSDETLKTKIDDIPVDFEKLKEITKFIFHWNDDETKKREFGVTAQSLEKVYPELVSTDENTGLKSVSYEKLAVVALAAVDKLYDKQKDLESRLNKLEKLLSK